MADEVHPWKTFRATITETLAAQGADPKLADILMTALYPLITRENECVMANHNQAKELGKQIHEMHRYEEDAFKALAATWNHNPAAHRMVEGFLEEYYPAEWRKTCASRDWMDPIRLEDSSKLSDARRVR